MAMSSQSVAVAPATVNVAASEPSSRTAKKRAVSPLSLWVHHTPGWSGLATIPDASVRSADVTVPRFTVDASVPPHAAARRSTAPGTVVAGSCAVP